MVEGLDCSQQKSSSVEFDPKSHTYTLDGMKLTSVTKIINTVFFEPFDENKIAKRLSESSQNPKYSGKKPDEIKEIWTIERDKGTAMHESIEKTLKGDPSWIQEATPEALQFKSFCDDINFGFCKFVEKRVANKRARLAGSIDFGYYIFGPLFTEAVLIDWKRSDKTLEAHFGKFGKNGLEHLEDTSYSKYSLQLNLYKWLLEQENSNIKVIRMIIVQMHPNKKNYNLIEVNSMDKEINVVIKYLCKEAARRKWKVIKICLKFFLYFKRKLEEKNLLTRMKYLSFNYDDEDSSEEFYRAGYYSGWDESSSC